MHQPCSLDELDDYVDIHVFSSGIPLSYQETMQHTSLYVVVFFMMTPSLFVPVLYQPEYKDYLNLN
jgi:hypothetical protein